MKEKILKILQTIIPDITDGLNLIEEEMIDSFKVIKIVMKLEEAFEIEIDAEDVIAQNFESVDTIVSLVEKTINQ